MRFRAGKKAAASSASNNKAAAADGNQPVSSPVAAATDVAAASAKNNAGGGVLIVASPDHDGTENGSKDESFFESRPWLDSDSEDDFHSMRGGKSGEKMIVCNSTIGVNLSLFNIFACLNSEDFTPSSSRGSTPDHQRQTPFAARISVDRLKPSLIEKKQRLLELLQEKQQYDDEHDSTTDVSSEMGNSIVHAEEHLRSSRKGEKAKKQSKRGCFPGSVWKLSFKSCWKKKKEQKD